MPRHWFGGNAVATAIANGVNLLFPAGERFFVRSVAHYLDQVDDPHLLAQIKGFFGQEGRHANEHDHVARLMRAQGFEVDRFLAWYEHVAYDLIEKAAPPSLRLAVTAACEHFTAIMAENALSKGLLDGAHPDMRALLLWHASEEIEHRAVAFDVLQKVAPGYGTRMAGLAVATVLLSGFWAIATTYLLLQEKKSGSPRLGAEWLEVRRHRGKDQVFLKGIQSYVRRDFHPSQHDIDGLASAYLAQAGLA